MPTTRHTDREEDNSLHGGFTLQDVADLRLALRQTQMELQQLKFSMQNNTAQPFKLSPTHMTQPNDNTVTSVTRKIALTPPPRFSGLPAEDSSIWSAQQLGYLQMSGSSNAEKLIMTTNNLGGDAAKWFVKLTNRKPDVSCEGALELLQQRFPTYRDEQVFQVRLDNLRQTGPIAAYISQFRAIADELPTESFSRLLTAFKRGSNPRLRSRLTQADVSNMEEVFELAFRWDTEDQLWASSQPQGVTSQLPTNTPPRSYYPSHGASPWQQPRQERNRRDSRPPPRQQNNNQSRFPVMYAATNPANDYRNVRGKTFVLTAKLAELRNKHIDLFEQPIMVIDSGACINICSRAWLNRQRFPYQTRNDSTAIKILTASGCVESSTHMQTNIWITPIMMLNLSAVVIDVEFCLPILLSASFLHQNAAVVNFRRRVMSIKRTPMQLGVSPSGLLFLPIRSWAVRGNNTAPATSLVPNPSIPALVNQSPPPPPPATTTTSAGVTAAEPHLLSVHSSPSSAAALQPQATATIEPHSNFIAHNKVIQTSCAIIDTNLPHSCFVAADDPAADIRPAEERVQVTSTQEPHNAAQLNRSDLEKIIRDLHKETGHSGVTGLFSLIKRYVTFPSMKGVITQAISSCSTCATVKRPNNIANLRGSIQAKAPHDVVAVDLVDMGCTSVNGFRYLLTMQDQYSRYLEAQPLKSKRSVEVKKAFKERWIDRYQTPTVVKSDQGTEFADQYHKFLEWLDIRHELTPTAHPQSNGMLERRHFDLVNHVKSELIDRSIDISRWDEVVPVALAKLNRKPFTEGHKAGKTACELFYNRAPMMHSMECLKQLFWQPKHLLEPNTPVLFRHPGENYAKLENQWKRYIILERVSNLLYYVKPIHSASRDKKNADVVLTHRDCLRLEPQQTDEDHTLPQHQSILQQQHTTETEQYAQDTNTSAAAEQITCRLDVESMVPGEIILWRHHESKVLSISKILEVYLDAKEAKVQAYGAASKGSLKMRQFLPSWLRSRDQCFVLRLRNSGNMKPEEYQVPFSDILERNVQLTAKQRLPRNIALKYGSGFEGYHFPNTIRNIPAPVVQALFNSLQTTDNINNNNNSTDGSVSNTQDQNEAAAAAAGPIVQALFSTLLQTDSTTAGPIYQALFNNLAHTEIDSSNNKNDDNDEAFFDSLADSCRQTTLHSQNPEKADSPKPATTHQQVVYRQLSEQERDSCNAARQQELDKFLKYEVYHAVPISSIGSANIVPTIWVDSLKLVTQHQSPAVTCPEDQQSRQQQHQESQRVYKSRLVARGDLDKRKHLETTTTACSPDGVRLMLLASMSQPGWTPDRIMMVDFNNAYLQSPLNSSEPVYVRPPSGHPDRIRNHVWKLSKAMYGLPDAGNAFEKFKRKILAQLHWEETALTCIWIKRSSTGTILGMFADFVDDSFMSGWGSHPRELIAELQQFIDCKEPSSHLRFVGIEYSAFTDRISLSQTDYIRSISIPHGKPPKLPLPVNVLDEVADDQYLINSTDQQRYRQVLGSISWVAMFTRADLSYACSYLSRFMQSPTQRSWRLLCGLVRFAQATASVALTLYKPSGPISILSMYCDASIGTNYQPAAQTGWVLTFDRTIVAWKSHKQQRVASSSTRAELFAVKQAVDYVESILPFTTTVWPNARIQILTDANNICSLVATKRTNTEEKALQRVARQLIGKLYIRQLYAVVDAIDQLPLQLIKIDTADNLSDCLTKPMSVKAILQVYRGIIPSLIV